MVQKTKKTAPQEDFRKLEIESVFSTTSSKQHSVPQKELETRVNQIHQVFEGKWQKADIRRALEENEYNVEEVIKLRLEGGDQWTEVKKKPTPQQVRKTKKSSDTAVNTGATRGKSVRGGTARGRGRGGIDRSNGRQANKADDQKVEDTSSLTVIPTDAHDTTSVSQDTDAFFEQPSESAETTPLTSTTTPPTTTTTSSEKTQRVKRDVQQKKRPAVEKLVPSQPPKQEEKMLSYSEVAAIPDNQPQKVEQDDKLKKQKKPKQQKAKPVKQESQASAPQQVVEKQVERLAPQAQLQPQQPQQPQQQQLPQQVQQPTQQQPQQPQRKEETKKFTATQQPQAENVLSGPFRNVIQFGSLDTDDHADDEPKTLLEQPSAPQISNRRQSQQQQQEVQQQQQLDFGYHGNAGSWGEEQYNQYHAEAVNQFHDPQGFFANYVPQQQQQQQPTQDTGKTTDKDNQNAQATQKQTGYTGYPMHPYTNHMQGYPSYPYGGYPHHPYMLPNQYAQQQYGYGPSQSYAKFGYKGYGAPSSPTYGSNTPPSDDKGAQQHATHSQYGMMQPQYFMMPQYMPDPSLTEKQEPLKSGTTRSPQNVDPSEQHGVPSYYPYGMPYNQYANYVYQPHPHSNLFAHQQGAQTNPSNTQQRGANDSWSS